MNKEPVSPCPSYQEELETAVLESTDFLLLTLSGALGKEPPPWKRIRFRPMASEGRRPLQISYETATQVRHKNLEGPALQAELRQCLALPFSNLHLQRTSGDLHVRITRKGRVLMSRSRPSRQDEAPGMAHDRARQHPLPGTQPDAFLQTIGIQDAQGRLRATMRDKFRQINGFIGLLAPLFETVEEKPLFIVDGGCGSAWLTFALCHYLKNIRRQPVRMTGIDLKQDVIEKCTALRDQLGWSELDFEVSSIAAYQPPEPPGLVLSLHACDTATDEVIARGVEWNSRAIVAAPCCQHELHHRLAAPLFAPLLRHGILRERLADVLTDTFRALLLRGMGYRVQVMEFVSAEATPKNLMIRAEKTSAPGDPEALREYQELKRFWGVEPCLEKLLGLTMASQNTPSAV